MPENTFSSFANYKMTLIEITGDLKKLCEFSERLNIPDITATIGDAVKRLTEDCFNVAVVGEFNRGKSTLINALLGKAVLPMDVLPTTATLSKITYGIAPFIKITYKGGGTEDVAADKLNDYLTKLTYESEQRAKTIEEATVYYPVNYCKNGVNIIDTPGLNDDCDMQAVTLKALLQADAAIMVIMAQVPFSESERDFLENKIMAGDLGRVMFVVSGIDLLDADDIPRVLQNIENRIKEYVVEKAEKTYGVNSAEYENYIRKIGQVKTYGISAKKALKAKITGDSELLEQSGFPVFEAALEHFLTEDRGAVMLNAPLNRIKTASVEITKAAEVRLNTLNTQKELSEREYQAAINEIEQIRHKRKTELERVTESAETAIEEVRPSIDRYWNTLLESAESVIEAFPIESIKRVKKEAAERNTREGLTAAIKDKLSRKSREMTGSIRKSVTAVLQNEAGHVDFERDFHQTEEKIEAVNIGRIRSGSSVPLILVCALNLFFGSGSVYSGAKEEGLKGALLGLATPVLMFLFICLVGFDIGYIIIFWPFLCVGGAFVTKVLINGFFKNRKILRYREEFKKAVTDEIAKMRRDDNFSGKIRDQITELFDELIDKKRSETEGLLAGLQERLSVLRSEIAQRRVAAETENAELKSIISVTEGIRIKSENLSAQLTEIMKR